MLLRFKISAPHKGFLMGRWLSNPAMLYGRTHREVKTWARTSDDSVLFCHEHAVGAPFRDPLGGFPSAHSAEYDSSNCDPAGPYAREADWVLFFCSLPCSKRDICRMLSHAAICTERCKAVLYWMGVLFYWDHVCVMRNRRRLVGMCVIYKRFHASAQCDDITNE